MDKGQVMTAGCRSLLMAGAAVWMTAVGSVEAAVSSEAQFRLEHDSVERDRRNPDPTSYRQPAGEEKPEDFGKSAEKNGAMSFSMADRRTDALLAKKWGIRLLPLRSTAAGNMLDFRYEVLDARKSAPLFRRETKPYLLHQSSGKVLAVPNTAKVGPLRNSDTPREGKHYWMFFRNTGQLVSKGDKVTVIIGDFRVEDIVVE